MKPGDTLVIKSIDRLGRNYDEILKQRRFLKKDRHMTILVLDRSLLNTHNGWDMTGSLMISDIVLRILSYAEQADGFHNKRCITGMADLTYIGCGAVCAARRTYSFR